MKACKHSDCVSYESVDVTKGICLLDERFVSYDANACSRFSKKPKCRHCQYYAAGSEDGMGDCTGLSDGSHWISGEMNASTCAQYQERTDE